MSLLNRIFEDSNNKSHWKRLSQEIIDEGLVADLMTLFLAEDKRVSQRASSFFMTIIDIDERQILPFIDELVDCLSHNPSSTQKRNIIRFFQTVDIPERHLGKVYTFCIEYLSDLSEAIAVRAFSMKVAYNISENHPELKPELEALILFNLEQNPSSGIKNRGQKILQKLQKDIRK